MPTFDPSQPYDVISEPRVTRGSTFGDQNGPGADSGDNGQFAYGGSSVNNPEDYAALPVGSGVPPGYQFPVLNPATGDVTWVTHRDKGPAQWTGRGIDLAPSAMAKLNAQTDDPLVVDTAKAVPPFDPSKPYQVVSAQAPAQQPAIPSPTLSQEVGPPQATPAATDARTQHLIDSSHIGSQRDLEDIAASLPGYRQSRDASPADTRDKLAKALDHNLSPFLDHPLDSAYNMVVPNRQDFEAIGNLVANPRQAFSRNGPPAGSQEYLDQAVGYALPLLGLGKEAFRGATPIEPRLAEAPKTEAAAPATTTPPPPPPPAAPVEGTEGFARVNTAPQSTHELVKQSIGWQNGLQAERAILQRQGDIAQAVSGNVPGTITRRIGEIDAELKRGYQPFQEDLTPAVQHANVTANEGTAETVLRPENEPPPSTGAETSPAPGLLQDEGATERPNAAPARESTSVAGQAEPGISPEAGSTLDSEGIGVTKLYSGQRPGGTRTNWMTSDINVAKRYAGDGGTVHVYDKSQFPVPIEDMREDVPGEPTNAPKGTYSFNRLSEIKPVRSIPAEEGLGVTGVSRAARDAAGEVDRTTAAVLSAEDHVQNGQRLEAQGADPDVIVKDAVDRGSFSRDATDLAIKRDADLTKAARQARRAADQAPGNRGLSVAADIAEKAQQQWEDYAIRPIRGQFADTGLSLQTAIDLDTGDYVDYRKQFAKQNGREPTPVEADQLKGATRTARKLSDANSADLSRIEKAAKPKRIMNRDELRDSLSKTKTEALADCLV